MRAGPEGPAASWARRAAWHRRAALLPLGYLAAALVTAPLAAAGLVSGWLVLHLVLLGAATNAIVVWSAHFAAAVLRAPAPARRPAEAARLAVLNAGIAAVLAGGAAGAPATAIAGAAVVFAAIAAHLAALAAALRRALPARFAVTVRYYLLAGLALLTGIPAGAWMLALPDSERPRLLLVHAQVNVLGWVGITVLGTFLTLWPTVLRTRLPPGAERAARLGLGLDAGGLAMLAAGSGLWLRPLIGAGLAVFAGGAAAALAPAVRAARSHPPDSFAALSMAAGACWLLACLGWDAWALLTAPGPVTAAGRFDSLSLALAAGFAAQVIAGALAHLLPMALGGGPAAVRQNTASLGRLGRARVAAANAGLVALLWPAPAALRAAGLGAFTLALALFLGPALALLRRAGRRARPGRRAGRGWLR